jgi:tetratricopeptide (TPR) repeat protein
MKTTTALLLLPALTTGLLLHAQAAWGNRPTITFKFSPKWFKARGPNSTEPARDPETEEVDQPCYHSLMVRAARHYSFKNYPAALTNYRRVLLKQPDDMAALSGEAWSLYYMGQEEQAVKDFQTLLTIDSHDSWALEGMALCRRKIAT